MKLRLKSVGVYSCPCRNWNGKDVLYRGQQISSSSFYQDEVETPSIYWMEWEENCIEIFYFSVGTADTLENAFTKLKN